MTPTPQGHEYQSVGAGERARDLRRVPEPEEVDRTYAQAGVLLSDVEAGLAWALHDEFWGDSLPRENGEACCLPSARRILARLAGRSL